MQSESIHGVTVQPETYSESEFALPLVALAYQQYGYHLNGIQESVMQQL